MMNGEEEAEAERRRCVTEATHLIPLNMDYHDGCVVLTILYDIGWLQTYFRQREEREEDPELKLWNNSLDCEDQFQFDNVESINTDSCGRITYFNVPFIINDEFENDDDEIAYYDLPPSVSRLRQLRKLEISWRCQRMPVELSDLPFLTEIKFDGCARDLFDNIPVGLQLPHLESVSVRLSDLPNSLVPFFNSLPNGLKELHFDFFPDRVESKNIISALHNNQFEFHQSLITFRMSDASVDDDGFELLVFKVLPLLPNLRDLVLNLCGIKSLRGVEKKIEELGFVSNTKLTKLDLRGNDILYKGLVVSSEEEEEEEVEVEVEVEVEKEKEKEKSAALLLLNTFDTISNLGAMIDQQYDPDIERALRNNLMKRSFTDEGISGTWPSNAALWPFMLEKVYNNSWKVYNDDKYSLARQESKMKKKCATELFHMVRYGSIFAVDQYLQHEITTTATTAPATRKQRTQK